MAEWVDSLRALPFVQRSLEIWISGGWAMIALAVDALLLFTIGSHLWLKMRGKGARRAPEKVWRRWLEDPARRRGTTGRVMTFLLGAQDVGELTVRVGEIHAGELAPFDRDLRFMRRAVSTAPLLGLLGTVTGMLATFAGLSAGPGGDKTMDLVAGGISEALITTQTGLMIALPGLFFQYHLTRQRDRYEGFLAHLETVCAQALFRKQRAASPVGASGAES